MAETIVNIGIGDEVVQNDFDTKLIYKDMQEVTDDYGNKFIRIPKFYIQKENTAEKFAIRISQEPIAGGYLPHCFYDHVANKELDHIDVGKYIASLSSDGTKLESKSGKTVLYNRSIVDFRTLAQANGSGYQQLDIHVIDVLQCLFYVEFATLNSQSIHAGCVNKASRSSTGGTDGVVASSGAMGIFGGSFNNKSEYQFMYRGIEDLWGNLYQFVDGVNINDHQAWVCNDARDYASNVFADPYEQLGYINSNTNGWVTDMGYDPNHPYAQFPIAVGGDDATYYTDNYYQTTGQRACNFGGFYGSKLNAGLSCWSISTPSSYTSPSASGRLIRKPL